MADKGKDELPRLFSRLKRATEDEDDELALEFTRKILELSPDDPDALRCRLICLIHLSNFDAALELIHALNKKRKASGEASAYQLEEAYCLYRQEKYDATLKVLSALPAEDVKVMELVAQVAYRQEQYAKAMQIYAQLLEQEKNKQERFANYYASVFLCPASEGETDPPLSVSDTMEQCFNLACCCLSWGRVEQAMQLLEKAESLYRVSLEEEGLTEEEIAEEMAVIDVQKGYCYHVSEGMSSVVPSTGGCGTCGRSGFDSRSLMYAPEVVLPVSTIQWSIREVCHALRDMSKLPLIILVSISEI